MHHSLGERLIARLGLFDLGVLIVDRSGRIVDADGTALGIVGRDLAGVRGLADVAALLAPEERFTRTARRNARRTDGSAPDRFTTVVLRPDGLRRPVDVAVVPLDDRTTAVVIRDRDEIAARDHVIDWYAALVDRMPIGVAVVDATTADEATLVAANAAMSALVGRDLALDVGRPVREVDGLDPADDVARALALARTDRVAHLPESIVGDPDRPDAVHRRTLVSLPAHGFALLVHDITDERVDELLNRQLAERIVTISDTERRAIAMGIHDDPIQDIAAAALLVGQLRRTGAPMRPDWLDEIDTALTRATHSLRQLVFDLIPPELVESGLASAVSRLAHQVFVDGEVQVEIRCELVEEPPHAVQSTAYRIVAEALRNVHKHAGASRATVTAQVVDDMLVVEVSDDGTGIVRGAAPGHVGLRSVHDRAAAVGGVVEVLSSEQGTTVTARLPVDERTLFAPRPLEATIPLAPVDSDVASLRLQLHSQRDLLAATSDATRSLEHRFRTLTGLGAHLRAAEVDRAARADRAVRLVAAAVRDACAIRLADPGGATLTRVASWHPHPDQLAFLDDWLFGDRSLGDVPSHAALVFTSAEPMLIDRTRTRWLPTDGPRPPAGPFEPRTAIIAPLRTGAGSIGVLTVVRDATPQPLDHDDVAWVTAMCDIIAGAL